MGAKITAGVLLRSVSWGIGLGALVGFTVQLILLGPVTYGMAGLTLGAGVGFILGLANGFVILAFGKPLQSSDEDKLVWIVGILTLLLAAPIFGFMIYFVFRSIVFSAVIGLISAVFASLAAIFAAMRTSKWYIHAMPSYDR